MKKLMIAAVIVCAAAMSHAAAITWSIEFASNPFVEGGLDGANSEVTAYIFASSASLGGTSDTYGYDLAKAAIEAGTFDFASKAFDNTVSAHGFAGGSASNADGAGDFNVGTATAENEISLYAVLVTKDDKGVDRFYITDEGLASTSINDLGGSSAAAFGDLGYATTSTDVPGNWYAAAAVPEPTSGLLLLLGVAGLALRRRRA